MLCLQSTIHFKTTEKSLTINFSHGKLNFAIDPVNSNPSLIKLFFVSLHVSSYRGSTVLKNESLRKHVQAMGMRFALSALCTRKLPDPYKRKRNC